jgi:hypothetical protein
MKLNSDAVSSSNIIATYRRLALHLPNQTDCLFFEPVIVVSVAISPCQHSQRKYLA